MFHTSILTVPIIITIGLVFCSSTARAQAFDVPFSWRKPTTSLSRGDMEGLALSAVNTLVPLFNSSGVIPDLAFDQPAYTIAAISRTDYLSGNTTFKQLVLSSMKAVFAANPTISTRNNHVSNRSITTQDHNSNAVMWGLAATSAYRAYNDSASLAYAQTVWEQVSPFQIQPSDAAKGFASAVNASIPSNCNGSTTAGGVFAYPIDSTHPGASNRPTDVDGETVAAFVALSGHLYEFTEDSKYLDAAGAGAEFIQNHMQAYPIITDTFTVATCSVLNILINTYVSGFTIWGLSILATHNATWTPIMNSLILSSVPYTDWTSSADGIILEGPKDPTVDTIYTCLKAIWIRGLHEAWTRMDPTTDVANFLRSYLYVQFNALLDLAYTPSINAYSPIWQGPPATQLTSWGQLDALDVLNSAFAMAQVPTSPNATSTGSDVPSSSTSTATLTSAANVASSHSSKVPIIIGVVVGSVAAIAICGVIGFFVIRQRRRAPKGEITYDTVPSTAYLVDPYLSEMLVTQRPAVPPQTAEKGGYTVSSTDNDLYPSQSSSNSGPSSLIPASQREPEGHFPAQAHSTPIPATSWQETSLPSPDDPALPQMIANLTNLLASIPLVRQADEPPPRYAENDEIEDGSQRETETRRG